jgi:hypothetical protein
MRSHVRTAPFVEAAVSFNGFQLLVSSERNAIQGGHFVEGPGFCALHARAVVAPDVNNERVVDETHVLDSLHDLAHCMVGVLLVTGIHLHLARIHFP